MVTKKLSLPVELQPVSSHPLSTPISHSSLSEALDPATHDTTAGQDGRSTPHEGASNALPPVDSGPAFVFLAAATVLELLAWGYGLAVGVFHQYWSSTLFPEESAATQLTIAATLQTGLTYAITIFVGPLCSRYREYRIYVQYTGLALAVLGILLSGFATAPWHLIVTAGIVYPCGATIMWMPIASLTFEWFAKRRGIATGILYAGTSLGGSIFPIIMQTMLDRYSYKAASVSLALGYGLVGAISIPIIKERLPVISRKAGQSQPSVPISWDFLHKSAFYAFLIGGAVFALGITLPSIYIPSYAVDIGLSKTVGSTLVTVMNASSIFGKLLMGILSDRISLRSTILLSAFGGALSCFFLFGFATSLPTLIVFAIAWGVTGLGYTSLITRTVAYVAKEDPHTPVIVFSIFVFAQGVAMIASGPIASALLQSTVSRLRFGYGVESYGPLILWTGAVAAVGSMIGASYRTA